MKRLLPILICLLAASSAAFGQYAYTSSNVAMTSGNIYASNYVEVDYYTSAYYYVQAWNGLLQDCNGICSDTHLVASGWTYGSSSASWSASRPLTNIYYTSYAESDVVQYYSYYDYYYQQTFYQDQYGYSLMSEGWGTPYIYVWAPVVYLQTLYQVVPLSLAYSVGNATTNPPSVASLQLWSGQTGPGGSGYWVLYGSALANVFGPTTASTNCSGVSVTPSYAAPGQVNLAFSVASSAPVQTCNLTVWTPNGSSSIPVTVGFSFTSVQHTYPRNPLPQACWISSWFDAIRGAITRKAHGALDLILANGGSNDGGSVPMIGTPVTAMEDGTVDGAESGNGPASNPPYSATGPSCTDNPNAQGNRGNYVRIKGGDQYLTTYYHMTPAPGMTFGHPVVGGQTVIGYLDASGCQSKPHLHVQRNGPGYGPAVDLSIPCVNSNHQTQFDDGLVDDAVPDNL